MTQQPQQGWGAPPPQQQQYPQGFPQQQQQAPQGNPWGQPPAQQAATPPAQAPGADPFGTPKVPAVSFKDAAIGTTVIVEVTAAPEIVQSRNFEDNKLEFWEPEYPGAPPQPKWSVVTNGNVNGVPMALWAAKTSKEGSLCRAISDAQAEAGFRVAPGTRLAVQLIGEEPPPPDRPRNSPRKLYRAKLDRGAPGGVGDNFAQPPAQQAPPQYAPPGQGQWTAEHPAPQQNFGGPVPGFQGQPNQEGQWPPPAPAQNPSSLGNAPAPTTPPEWAVPPQAPPY